LQYSEFNLQYYIIQVEVSRCCHAEIVNKPPLKWSIELRLLHPHNGDTIRYSRNCRCYLGEEHSMLPLDLDYPRRNRAAGFLKSWTVFYKKFSESLP